MRAWMKRSLSLYLAIFLLSYFMIDNSKVRAKQLNQYRLPIDYLIRFSEGRVPFDSAIFKKNIKYYETVLSFLPNAAEVSSMLGFCYYYVGEGEKAIAAYENAIKQTRYFFWFHYNLRIIHFYNKNYTEAIKYFQGALKQSPRLTIGLTRISKIYLDVEQRKQLGASLDEV